MTRFAIFIFCGVFAAVHVHAAPSPPSHSWTSYVIGADVVAEVEISDAPTAVASQGQQLDALEALLLEHVLPPRTGPQIHMLETGVQFSFIATGSLVQDHGTYVCAFQWHGIHESWIAMKDSCKKTDIDNRDSVIDEILEANRSVVEATTSPLLMELGLMSDSPPPVRPLPLPAIPNPPGPVPAEHVGHP